MALRNCRFCASNKFKNIFSLGNVQYSGYFANPGELVPDMDLAISECEDCGLVQLTEKPDVKWMYGPFYGYLSGQNTWMVSHLSDLVVDTLRLIDGNQFRKENKRPIWLDVGSNDGTLLRALGTDWKTIGVDPNAEKFRETYKICGIEPVNSFFPNEDSISLAEIKGQVDVISSVSVFYDIEDPRSFVSAVSDLLIDGGLWVCEQSYFKTMVEVGSFDTICHEHLTYLKIQDFLNFTQDSELYPISVDFNEANGGSFRLTFQKILSRNRASSAMPPPVSLALETEKRFFSDDNWSEKLTAQLVKNKKEFRDLLFLLKGEGNTIFGLGASTKGNILIDTFDLDVSDIKCIGEINPEKFGKVAGSKQIPICNENSILSLDNAVFVVFPWHFRDSFLDNKKYSGKKLIFPLPDVAIYEVDK